MLQMTNHVVILLAGSWDSILCMPKSTYLLQAEPYMQVGEPSIAILCCEMLYSFTCTRIRRIYSGIGCNNIVLKFRDK